MLDYCDYIADMVSNALDGDLIHANGDGLIKDVFNPVMDLHPTEGYLLSTTKKVECTDVYGRRYMITVESIK
jgi:hypothetical protein